MSARTASGSASPSVCQWRQPWIAQLRMPGSSAPRRAGRSRSASALRSRGHRARGELPDPRSRDRRVTPDRGTGVDRSRGSNIDLGARARDGADLRCPRGSIPARCRPSDLQHSRPRRCHAICRIGHHTRAVLWPTRATTGSPTSTGNRSTAAFTSASCRPASTPSKYA